MGLEMDVSRTTSCGGQHIENVIIACDYAFYQGGAANVAIETAVALSQYSDYRIYCFTGNGDPCDDLKDNKITVKALHLPDLLGNKNKVDAMMKGIYNKNVEHAFKQTYRNLDPEETIVHIHTWTKVLTSAVFKAAHDMGFKTFLTVHEYFLACPNGACYNYVKKDICEIKPMSVTCLVCNCDARNYPQKVWRCIRQFKQNSVIRNFRDLNYIFISEYQRKQLLRRIPRPKNQFLVKNPIQVYGDYRVNCWENSDYLYIGRLFGEKGPQQFCEAVTKAGVKGVVIGEGLLKDELKKKYPNITFVGWVDRDHMDAYLKKARALVFPTQWYEGSPLTVPEAQAHGVPCIVTDCSSAVDDIQDGVNGLIVQRDAGSIAEGIKKFSDDELVKKFAEETYKRSQETDRSNETYVNELIKTYLAGNIF